MSTYRCAAGHRTERLTECTGWRWPTLGIHVPPEHDRAARCTCGQGPAASIACPASTGKSAPDALTIPPMCGRVARASAMHRPPPD